MINLNRFNSLIIYHLSDICLQSMILCAHLCSRPLPGEDRRLFISYMDSLLDPNHGMTLMGRVLIEATMKQMGCEEMIAEVRFLCQAADNLWSLNYRGIVISIMSSSQGRCQGRCID